MTDRTKRRWGHIHAWTVILAIPVVATGAVHLLVADMDYWNHELEFGWPIVYLTRDNASAVEQSKWYWFVVNHDPIVSWSLAALLFDLAVFVAMIGLAFYWVESTFRQLPGSGRLTVGALFAFIGFAATFCLLDIGEVIVVADGHVQFFVFYGRALGAWWMMRLLLIGAAWFGGVKLAAACMGRCIAERSRST